MKKIEHLNQDETLSFVLQLALTAQIKTQHIPFANFNADEFKKNNVEGIFENFIQKAQLKINNANNTFHENSADEAQKNLLEAFKISRKHIEKESEAVVEFWWWVRTAGWITAGCSASCALSFAAPVVMAAIIAVTLALIPWLIIAFIALLMCFGASTPQGLAAIVDLAELSVFIGVSSFSLAYGVMPFIALSFASLALIGVVAVAALGVTASVKQTAVDKQFKTKMTHQLQSRFTLFSYSPANIDEDEEYFDALSDLRPAIFS